MRLIGLVVVLTVGLALPPLVQVRVIRVNPTPWRARPARPRARAVAAPAA